MKKGSTIAALAACLASPAFAQSSVTLYGILDEGINYTTPEPHRTSIRVSNFDLAYRAACAGRGLALAWSYGASEMLRNGVLVRPLDVSVRTRLAEYIVVAEQYPLSAAAQCVLDALLEFASHTLMAATPGDGPSDLKTSPSS